MKEAYLRKLLEVCTSPTYPGKAALGSHSALPSTRHCEASTMATQIYKDEEATTLALRDSNLVTDRPLCQTLQFTYATM